MLKVLPTPSTMAAKSPIVLILGAGSNIGQAVARTFASRGYKIALAARSLDEAESTDNQLNIKSDFENPDDVVDAFKKVNKVLGIPSVVVYNGKSWVQRIEALLTLDSQCLHAHTTSGSVCPPNERFQSRCDNQYHKCFCRRSTSCHWFCTASFFGCKDIHLYWKHSQCCYHPVIYLSRRWKVGRRTYDLGCFSGI